jgi:hypothetical protein
MSKLDILPTPRSNDIVAPQLISPICCPSSQNLSWSQNNIYLFNDKLASLEMGTLHDNDVNEDGDIIFPGLPPLLRGHPDMHLREGVIRAACLSAAGVPDAENAYYVANLGYVYNQYERWKRNLPEIEPFYGARARHAQPSNPSLTCMRVWP